MQTDNGWEAFVSELRVGTRAPGLGGGKGDVFTFTLLAHSNMINVL